MTKNIMQKAKELNNTKDESEEISFLFLVKVTEFLSNLILIFMIVSLISVGDFSYRMSYSLFFSVILFVTRKDRNENISRELSFLYIQKCILLVIGIFGYIVHLFM